MRYEILNIREVAALRRMAEKIAYSMPLREQLPTFKVRGQWHVRHGDLDVWIDAQPPRPRGRGSVR